MILPKKIQDIIEDFKSLETNTEKYEELLTYADDLAEMPAEYKVQENLVPGCTSVVYIKTTIKEGKVQFFGSADSYLVKGLVAILINSFSGTEAKDFLEVQPDFLTELGLAETLSATRANASINIFNMMKKQTRLLF
ncbi:MAG: SufE family protein [Nanoarchaeota archaeon]|nr:SufE family protein [Nanoarchaeota archaeon]